MCQDIKRLITGRLNEQIRILENRNRLFILNYNLMYYSFSLTFIILYHVLLFYRYLR
ncbi:hypothetical protein C2G38_2111114 [Gigaspora rosea]|uniref:Uncharacterized protein n=1 Tax=Gigaspora rosea TaxID=44941 RepID=A0A397UE37_9GLOM|nr:hypothetical protein C2G38_2111114 [Gigaspora rosea]